MFKEFMDTILKAAFDPSIGLFSATPSQLLVPNPASSQTTEYICMAVAARTGILENATAVAEVNRQINHLHFFNFLGKMLGKALYEVP